VNITVDKEGCTINATDVWQLIRLPYKNLRLPKNYESKFPNVSINIPDSKKLYSILKECADKEIEFLFSGNDNGNAERLIIKSTSSELSLRCTDGRYPNIMDVMVKEYSKELVYDANTVQSQYDSILKQSGKRPSDFKCTFEISENNELTIFNGKEDDRITKPITSAIIKDLPNFVNVDFDKPIWAIASLNKGSMEVYKKLDASIYNAQIRINNKGIFVQCYIDLSSLVKQFKPVKIKGTKQGNLNTETTENKFKELLDFCELMLDGDLTQEEINKFSNLADLCEVMIER
jgi:hypothetical protein